MADIAAIVLFPERTVREPRGVIAGLQGALNRRVVIEQAKGMLAESAQIDVDAALVRLRAHARDHNRRLSDVARDVIDGRLDAAVGGVAFAGSLLSRAVKRSPVDDVVPPDVPPDPLCPLSPPPARRGPPPSPSLSWGRSPNPGQNHRFRKSEMS